MPHIQQNKINGKTTWTIAINVMKRVNNVMTIKEIVQRLMHIGWSETKAEETIEEMAAEDLIEIRYGRINDYIIL